MKTIVNTISFLKNLQKYITSKLFLVIAGRMHLSILTIPNAVISIAISYNGLKAKGTFKHYGLEDLVIEPKDISKIKKKCKSFGLYLTDQKQKNEWCSLKFNYACERSKY